MLVNPRAEIVPALEGIATAGSKLKNLINGEPDGATTAAVLSEILPNVTRGRDLLRGLGASRGGFLDVPETMEHLARSAKAAAASGLQPMGGWSHAVADLRRMTTWGARELEDAAHDMRVDVPEDLTRRIQQAYAAA